ncbi:MAG TPA: SIS domain-containing protein [Anaerolineaceae bacterium]
MSKILENEILEQPQVIENLLAAEFSNVDEIARKIRGKYKYVLIAARGTSDNAARYAQYLFGIHNRVQVALATPSLYTIYETPPDLSDALVLGISQSGQSPDIVAVITEAKRQGRPTIALTNDPSSPLAQAAHHVIPMNARREQAVAATKTYTSSLAALALLSCCLLGDQPKVELLKKVPDWMRQTFSLTNQVIHRVERYRYMQQCAVIGRGLNYATAHEIALKIKELSHVVAEPYSSADFRHGPIATVSKGFPILLITLQGAFQDDTNDLIAHLRRLSAEILLISDHPEILKQVDFPLQLPQGVPEWLSPLVAVIPGQMFAMRLTIEKHLDPDNPEGLTKVTETF